MRSLPDIPHQRQADHPPPVESGRLDRCPARVARAPHLAFGLEDRVDWATIRAQLRHPCGTAVLINREEPEENQEETS